MRAVQFSRFGAPHEVAEVVDLPEPTLRPGHVLVALEASPINPADLLNLQGKYGVVPPLPALGGQQRDRQRGGGDEAERTAVCQRHQVLSLECGGVPPASISFRVSRRCCGSPTSTRASALR